jgi:peptide deformylase
MAILKVARMGHPVLRARARAIDPGDIRSPRIQKLIDDLFDTMHEYQGIGLAAPQVHEGVRLFVAGIAPGRADDRDEDEEEGPDRVPQMALINPEIAPLGETVVEEWEGCLSIP